MSRTWPQARFAPVDDGAADRLSRIYLGHHYPLDVAGGALCGILIAFWVIGGRNPATCASTLPRPLTDGTAIRPWLRRAGRTSVFVAFVASSFVLRS